MSMILALKQASDDQIRDLLAEPGGIEAFLGEGMDVGGEVAARLAKKRGSFWAKLLGLQPTLSVRDVQDLLGDTDTRGGDDHFDLDKAWHGLHYLLTGSDWEGEGDLGYLVRGGEEIGDIDVGYGPARALTSQQVRGFADALAQLSDDNLRERFDADKMMELDIYPTVWGEEREKALEWLLQSFGELKAFASETAEAGKGLVVWLE